ncbi:MAG: hypothetical protein JWM11_3357 [Planctomycetaceae bacterium]|nr:hypothetical protein [Planctomycetaceae bacterium]
MLNCPLCNTEFDKFNIDYNTDLTYCVRCRLEYRYGQLQAMAAAKRFATSQCPKHLTVHEAGQRTEITYRRISPIVWFLIPLTYFTLATALRGGIDPITLESFSSCEQAVIRRPLLAIAAFLVCASIYLLLARIQIVLNGKQSEISRGFGWLVWRRKFDATQVRYVAIRLGNVSVNDETQPEIRLVLEQGSWIAFGALWTDESRQYVAGLLATKLPLL